VTEPQVPLQASDFDYKVPAKLIAQVPAPERDQSRLMVLHRQDGRIDHRRFADLRDYLQPGDALVLNDSRVMPARLRGVNRRTSGEFEVLLLEENALNDWWVLLRPGKRARPQTQILFKDRAGHLAAAHATVVDKNQEGHCRLQFSGVGNIAQALDQIGAVPLPPYIKRAAGDDLADDLVRYQTVYARTLGSVAAPTAGLHFTKPVLDALRDRGVRIVTVTLHVGWGTFSPVKTEKLEEHVMHQERFELDAPTADVLQAARQEGRRVLAVGTTTVRVLETVAARHEGKLVACTGRTNLFICPPYRFRVVNALLTNFHLPRSTLLMLVCAFAAPEETRGRNLVLRAYAEAVGEQYHFYSYGDAMLLV
jgi:S-adenosylmethionine:tRNA ribosyltransferase-isomerase